MNKLFIMAALCLPMRHLLATSPFGYRLHPITHQYTFHNGIDLRADHDTVFAVMPGVIVIGYDPISGVHILIKNADFQASYLHLSQIFVLSGDSVAAGQPIGVSGATGRVTGAHLHFSIKFKNEFIDPLKFLYHE